jgi:hypothetical protein
MELLFAPQMPRSSTTGQYTSDVPPAERRGKRLAYLRQWQADRQAKGLCRRCDNLLGPESRFDCLPCLERRRAYREQRFQEGWCTWCDKRPRLPEARLCPVCQERGAQKAAARRYRCKRACIDHFGGKCACCGEEKLAFLTLDHMDGNGNLHRQEAAANAGAGSAFYATLVRNKFQTQYALQVLCWNCNMGRQINGGICPHQDQ